MATGPDSNPNRAPWTRDEGAGTYATGASPYENSSPGQNQPAPQRKGLGCWFWGCMGAIVFGLLAIIAMGLGAYWFFTGQVEKYTDTQPAEIPVAEVSQEELDELKQRVEEFTAAVRGKSPDDPTSEPLPDDASKELVAAPPRELVLSADDINALIAGEEEVAGRLFVRIEDGQIFGEVSFPTDVIPGGKGRYFNADAEFEVFMEDGILEVRLVNASVKGQRIPEEFLQGFAEQNLARDVYNDPNNAEMLRKFETIEVRDDKVILKLKDPEPADEIDEIGATNETDDVQEAKPLQTEALQEATPQS